MKRKVGFLLGSGASLKAGLPSTNAITEEVLSGRDVCHNGVRYWIRPGGGRSDCEQLEKNLRLLGVVNEGVVAFHGRLGCRGTSYEDLYWMIGQVRDSVTAEYENAALEPFVDRLLAELSDVVCSETDLARLAWEACKYVRDVVWGMVKGADARKLGDSELDYLGFLKDAYDDEEVYRLLVFTVNHDTVVERYFSKRAIVYQDGFRGPACQARYWEHGLLAEECHLRLLKLHGSIDWFRYEMDGRMRLAIPPDALIRIRVPDGRIYHPMEDRPDFLVGTFNKMLDYTHDFFADIFCLFRRLLRNCGVLVISGYGFGDKGVNSQIGEWFEELPGRRLVVVDPDLGKLQIRARGMIRQHWDKWKGTGRFVGLERKIECVSWDDLRKLALE